MAGELYSVGGKTLSSTGAVETQGTSEINTSNGASASTTSLFLGCGTNAGPALTAVANKNLVDLRMKTTATSGDNRNIYTRTEFGGAGVSGESVRANSVITAAAATVHGVHGSIDVQTGGSVTGLGVGLRGGLIVRNSAMAANGTYAAIQSEIYANGTAVDVSPVTEISLIRLSLDGNATGIANIEDKANFLTIAGGTNASGNMVSDAGNEPSWTGKVHKLRAVVNGVAGYIIFVAN